MSLNAYIYGLFFAVSLFVAATVHADAPAPAKQCTTVRLSPTKTLTVCTR